MKQEEARRRVRELGGIAVEARPKGTEGDWVTGGWPHQKGSTWIVVSASRPQVVLDDTRTEGDTPG